MKQSKLFHSLLMVTTVVTLGMPVFNYGMQAGQPGAGNQPPLVNAQMRAEIGRWINAIGVEMGAQRQALGNMMGQMGGAMVDGMNQVAQDPAVGAAVVNIIGNVANGAAQGLNDPNIGNAFANGFGNAAGGIARGLDNPNFGRVFENGIGNLANGVANGLANPNIARGFKNFGAPWKEGGEAFNAFDNIGNVFSNMQFKLLIKPLAYATAISIVGAGGTAGCYYGAKALVEEWQRSRKRPQIIIETSYKTMWQRVKGLFSFGKKEEIQMIFPKDLQARLDEIAKATKNINQRINEGKTNVKYRNVLLHGKPGTGKTMFARKLAHECGMEFAMMSGSSFTKQGALEEMDHLFKWANNSKGLMLFIDEAESFLLKRETMKTDSYEYKVLTNFLNYTGTRSGKFMIVMATNRLSQIDSAIYRRVDDLVEVPLPQQDERVRVLKLYRDKVMFDVAQNGEAFVNSAKKHMTDAKIQEMATATDGLSNGDLEGIINSIKTSSDISNSGLVSATIVNTAIERYIKKQKDFEAAANAKA